METLIYSVCFGVGFLFAIVSALIGDLFGGHDAHLDLGSGGHADAGFGHADTPGLSPFSPTSIACFITAFGAFGLIFSRIELTRSPWISAPLAGTLIGLTATVITPIPSNGVGEIAYVQAGTRYTAPARNDLPTTVASGEAVRILRIVGSQFYVATV